MIQNDILVRTGGYECTDVTFYKIIKVVNGFVTLRSLKKKQVSFVPCAGTFGSGEVIPTDTFDTDTTIRKKIKYSNSNNDPFIHFNDYEFGYIWDGTPKQFDFTNI
ncbi:hypothetical protein UFOVP187_20 [uncultured Caudovirales phage]|uniref:Uncharacterized protein n=1 Tax=uncultured Caudovirales phage TaxID=2100421 RepID=A0A6J7WI43_9CAUD|nr:hypothetical protein UFOVP187_20 [uncultured Caudovirales phage]